LPLVGATALVAMLFTDLVGSTEAASRLGEEAAEEFRQTHFALLREGIGTTAARRSRTWVTG
jgi:class 3 adenylate cyclase